VEGCCCGRVLLWKGVVVEGCCCGRVLLLKGVLLTSVYCLSLSIDLSYWCQSKYSFLVSAWFVEAWTELLAVSACERGYRGFERHHSQMQDREVAARAIQF